MPYLVEPDDDGWGRQNDYLISAVHARGLPGVICQLCGVWAATGIIYPTVDVALIDSHVGELPAHPVSIEHYRALAARIQPIIGAERPPQPGANFGPLEGTACGLLGDFSWVNPWTMLVRSSTYQELLSYGFSLTGAEARIDFRDGSTEPLVELEAPCKAALTNLPDREVCKVCGRLSFAKPKTMVIDAASYHNTPPLQRIIEMPTYLVVSDEFGEFILARDFSNITLTRIERN